MLKIGHRGAPVYAPENTLRSFKKALEMGVDSVEFDIRRTKDDVLVVLHDATLERTTNGAGFLRDRTLQEVRVLDAGEGERVPTLAEALEFLKGKTRVTIELKERDCVPRLRAALHTAGPWNAADVMFLAFDEKNPEASDSAWADLAELKNIYPQFCTALLFTPRKMMESGLSVAQICETAVAMKADALAPWSKMVTKEMIDLVHAYRLKIFTWVVDSRSDAVLLGSWGIDGIASNDPATLI